jgi:hypothetical protein
VDLRAKDLRMVNSKELRKKNLKMEDLRMKIGNQKAEIQKNHNQMKDKTIKHLVKILHLHLLALKPQDIIAQISQLSHLVITFTIQMNSKYIAKKIANLKRL